MWRRQLPFFSGSDFRCEASRADMPVSPYSGFIVAYKPFKSDYFQMTSFIVVVCAL